MNPGTNKLTLLTPVLAAFTLVITTGFLVACGGSGTEASPPTGAPPTVAAAEKEVTDLGTMTVSGSKCRLEAAFENPIAPGGVALTAVNATKNVAAFHMWSLQEGTTYEEFADYIDEERRLAEAGKEGLGHPPFVVELIASPDLAAGQSGTMEGTVRPGTTYGIVCLKVFKGDDVPRPLALLGPVEIASK